MSSSVLYVGAIVLCIAGLVARFAWPADDTGAVIGYVLTLVAIVAVVVLARRQRSGEP